MKKLLSLIVILPLTAVFIWSSINFVSVLVQELMAGWVDLTNWSLFNWINPTTSPGGSASIIDILIGGPGAVGGTAVRYFMLLFYGVISGFSFFGMRSLWEIVKFEE